MKPCRRHRPSRIREKHCYTIEEAADVLGAHKNTIRQWIKQGLPCIDASRPTLIYGSELKAFLVQRQQRAKRPCGKGEIYCLRCRVPRAPWEGIVDIAIINQKMAQLTGICSVCEGKLNRRTSIAKLPDCALHFKIQQLTNTHIIVRLPDSLKCYL